MASSLDADQNRGLSSGILSLLTLKGKTAIVSGGTGGIGLAIVEILADVGANVAILYHRNKDAIESARIEQRHGVKCKCRSLALSTELTNLLMEVIFYCRHCISSRYNKARRSRRRCEYHRNRLQW